MGKGWQNTAVGKCRDGSPNWATIASLHILCNSLFTNHPTLRYWLLKAFHR
jgi:hypothetical protein